ncbi:MAG: sensor histidine kinase [Desulfobacteraceae bacterium]|nr:MAG: sensor histidine kinase [Desulfobacteraceae bacterium]
MKPQISLKWFVALSFLTLTIVLVIGYSLLSARFFVRGMDNAIAGNMAQVVDSFVSTVPASQREQLNRFSGYQIADNWLQMPEKIRRVFKEPRQTDVLLKHDDSGWFTPPDEVFFVMRVMQAGDPYFISRSVTRETASALVGRNAAQNIRLLLTLSIIIVLTLAAIIWLLFRQIARPVNALGQWARALNEKNLHETPPDFSYPELNSLATLIRTGLSSVQESLEREHRFLRHSSHELRTPISVIRNNVELLNKLQENTDKKWGPRQAQAINRIDRASLTMKRLTEMLLWLSRESDEHLPLKKLDLEKLIRDLIEEERYLLKDKQVDIIVETAACIVTVAEIPARIVLDNLIRNAFQHTCRGTIRITQKNGTVEIINDMVDENDMTQDLGFGLGLQLTEQLTRKLNWSYNSSFESERHRAWVCIG